ncbi:mandelate racemase/muconate lactonizing enzyme family protein [Actinospica sp.]|jgi:L-alanine-DL-glutamate epimerase-like enolase superfamily enzyme|uniref:mandelate racemase/muconate lactonizing enzyme family protein n=1 Tax=Actinospica sp. TaxID=1872142 RepID=UPI002C69454E|nr:mandelate racemase/muconate lactonizing enzyme family protein [Actinospica sp.]HWG22736.1 mandelate racemase/muconate lactonizing enzyme family protein [Actinospica sp.]
MKITHIALERLRLPLDPPFQAAWEPEPWQGFETTLVRVHTDEGITGVATAGDTLDGFDTHRQLFLGTDPLDIVAQVRTIEAIGLRGAAYWSLEAACWDIIGQVTGQPVSVLFGNAAKRLPAYASTGELRSPADRAESASALKERGFRAMKIRMDRTRLREGIEAVRRTREAVGDEFEIMVDLDQSWQVAGSVAGSGGGERTTDLVRTRKLVAELGELGVFWVENPLPYPDLPGYKRLRADIPHVRIAAGGLHRSVPELLRSLELDALDVYQMDVVQAVGMLRARTLAELALLKHRHYTPHTWSDGIALLANLHVAAGIGGGPYFEFPYDPPTWTPRRRDFMLAEPLDIDPDGFLTVPQTPGLGIELDEDAVAGYRVD